MKLLIDTNVILDFLLNRPKLSEASSEIIKLTSEEDTIECVTASSITDIFYILNKELKNVSIAKHEISELLELITVLEVTNKDIQDAIHSDWDDFEDSVQYYVALNNSVDIIITRNRKDFLKSVLPVYTPEEFLQQL